MASTLETVFVTDDVDGNKERLSIFRHGVDDYSVEFENGDFSIRGTFEDVCQVLRQWELI